MIGCVYDFFYQFKNLRSVNSFTTTTTTTTFIKNFY